jgi:hypothetical protein
MDKRQIGFGRGVAKSPETKWEKKLDDATVTYTKITVGGGFFIYECKCRRGATITVTSWQALSDMPQDEVEQIPRFVDFLAGRIS